ncbi:hypothetical protein SELMODRAFT_440639 [Selaginella moellendorffii]|uniref:Uncharacterized protein n=1 Tax=Selaginella moellendorffii TaxID=88036 RepID=D8RD58_SELML|nr:hypothetical protein SELMODRAFT_440639 [Selaginella moellendorffii]
MQPHREDSAPNAAAVSVETRLDNSELGPGIATGSTVDRTDISTASSAGLTAAKKSFPPKAPQPRKGDEEEIKRGGSGIQGSSDGVGGGLQREDSLESAMSKTSSSSTTTISPIVPVTKEAYGGGIYGKDDEPKEKRSNGGGGGGGAAPKVYEDGSAIPYIQ